MKKRIMALLLACSLAFSSESMVYAAGADQDIATEASGEEAQEENQPEQESEGMQSEYAEISEDLQLEEVEASQEIEMEKVDISEVPMLESQGANVDYWEVEFNNSADDANEVSLQTTIHGSITDNDPVDFYKVTLPVAGNLQLTIHSKMECYTVAIYTESLGGRIADECNWWNSTLQEITNTHDFYLDAGVYYIQMLGSKYLQSAEKDKFYVDYTGDYTCTLNYIQSSLTETEPNNKAAEADTLAFGVPMRAQLSWCYKAHDCYMINVPKTGKVNIAVTAWIGEYQLSLYSSKVDTDGDLTERLMHQYNIDWSEELGWKSVNSWDCYLEPGIYYIVVDDGYYSDYYRGIYELTATYTDSKTTFTVSDDSAAEAIAIDFSKTYKGQISLNDDYDVYKLTMPVSRNVPLSITSYMKGYGAIIFDAAGTTIWESDSHYLDSGETSRTDDYIITLGSGIYYLKMYAPYGDYTGTYTFSFSAGELTSLKLNQTSLRMNKGDTYQLQAIMTPKAVAVSWSSDNPSVVTVEGGKLTAKGYGTATITCTAKDGSGKKATCKVTIATTPISKTKISSIPTKIYTGKAIRPSVKVTYNGKTLKAGKDYSVSYKNNKSIGTATATITGKGAYSGTKTLSFKIIPKTAKMNRIKISNKKAVLTWMRQNSVSGYEVYMSKTGQHGEYKKIKTITSSAITKYTTGVLAEGKAYYYKIRAYKNVGGKKVYGNYSAFRSVARGKAEVNPAKLYSATVKDKKAVLTWMRQDSVSGYVVYMSKSLNGTYKAIKGIKKSSTTKYTTGVLAQGQTYYFKIRPYKNINGKRVYGGYSEVKTVKW